jgi:hypothetical protein
MRLTAKNLKADDQGVIQGTVTVLGSIEALSPEYDYYD